MYIIGYSGDMKKLQPKRWRLGRLVIIRYVFMNESLVGVIFGNERSYRRTVEVMTGRSNYVFYIGER
jgi:hypothetical protein